MTAFFSGERLHPSQSPSHTHTESFFWWETTTSITVSESLSPHRRPSADSSDVRRLPAASSGIPRVYVAGDTRAVVSPARKNGRAEP
jgi:hypothetical protein